MPKTVSQCPGCVGCPLAQLFPDNTFVEPRLGKGLRLAIAEAPGETEAARGEPLVGGAGGWFRGREVPQPDGISKWYGGLLREAGINDAEMSYANCIQCQPPNNVFPTDREARSYISREDGERAVQQCLEHYVKPLLHQRPWRRIDILGNKPLKYICGKSEGIETWRGSPLAVPELGPQPLAIPTIHPAAIARSQELLPAVVSDLKKDLTVPPEFYNLRPAIEDVKAFTATEFAFDIETDYPRSRQITMVGLAAEPFHAIVVPFAGAYIPELKRIFRNAQSVIAHNGAQFDTPYLAEFDVPLNPQAEQWDTMLMQHLLQPDMPHDLGFVGTIFTNKPVWWLKDQKQREGLEPYCARDVDVTIQAYRDMRPLLVQEGLERLYRLVQVPLAKICKLMQDTGVRIDREQIAQAREEFLVEIKQLEANLPEPLRTRQVTVHKRQPASPGTLGKSGKPVKYIHVEAFETEEPWRSAEKLKAFFYETLGLPVQPHLKTGEPTADKQALEKLLRRLLRGEYHVREDCGFSDVDVIKGVKAMQRIRKLGTLVSSFCTEEMAQARGPERMHPHFNVHGTNSGRLSSSNPNLQNIPETTRFIYVPSHAGWVLCEVDFAGIAGAEMFL